jgi:hypothetical protein
MKGVVNMNVAYTPVRDVAVITQLPTGKLLDLDTQVSAAQEREQPVESSADEGGGPKHSGSKRLSLLASPADDSFVRPLPTGDLIGFDSPVPESVKLLVKSVISAARPSTEDF